MKTIYLAGPMTGLTFEKANEWRTTAERTIKYTLGGCDSGFRAINPFRGKEDLLSGAGELKPFGYTNPIATDQGITSRDRNDTMRADCVLMNFLGAKKISAGTMVELGWADAARIPVIVIMEEKGNPHDHCMVRAIATYRVTTVEDAIHLAKHLIG